MALTTRSVATHGAAGTAGAVLIAAAALVTPLEGVITHPYYDSVHVLTWCVGETEGPHKAHYTVDECKELLAKRLPEYYAPMMKNIGRDDVPFSVQVAMLSVEYNIGIAGLKGSSMMRDMRAGRWREACEDLKKWWKAGNNPTLLKSRREIERKKCLEDVNAPPKTVVVQAAPKKPVKKPLLSCGWFWKWTNKCPA